MTWIVCATRSLPSSTSSSSPCLPERCTESRRMVFGSRFRIGRSNSKASYLPRAPRDKLHSDPDHGSYKLTLTSNEDCINHHASSTTTTTGSTATTTGGSGGGGGGTTTTNGGGTDVFPEEIISSSKCNLPDVLPPGVKYSFYSTNNNNNNNNNNSSHLINNNSINNHHHHQHHNQQQQQQQQQNGKPKYGGLPHSAPIIATANSLKSLFNFGSSAQQAPATCEQSTPGKDSDKVAATPPTTPPSAYSNGTNGGNGSPPLHSQIQATSPKYTSQSSFDLKKTQILETIIQEEQQCNGYHHHLPPQHQQQQPMVHQNGTSMLGLPTITAASSNAPSMIHHSSVVIDSQPVAAQPQSQSQVPPPLPSTPIPTMNGVSSSSSYSSSSSSANTYCWPLTIAASQTVHNCPENSENPANFELQRQPSVATDQQHTTADGGTAGGGGGGMMVVNTVASACANSVSASSTATTTVVSNTNTSTSSSASVGSIGVEKGGETVAAGTVGVVWPASSSCSGGITNPAVGASTHADEDDDDAVRTVSPGSNATTHSAPSSSSSSSASSASISAKEEEPTAAAAAATGDQVSEATLLSTVTTSELAIVTTNAGSSTTSSEGSTSGSGGRVLQRTEIVLRVQAPTSEAASQTELLGGDHQSSYGGAGLIVDALTVSVGELTIDTTAGSRKKFAASTDGGSPSTVANNTVIEGARSPPVTCSVATSTPSSPTGTGSPTRNFFGSKTEGASTAVPATPRKLHPEEIDCDKLSHDLVSQLSPSDKLHTILAPKTVKSSSDYVSDLFNIQVAPRPPKKDASTAPPPSSAATATTPPAAAGVGASPPSAEGGGSPKSPLEILTSSSTYFQISEPKAKLMTRYSREMTLINGDCCDLTKKKEELVQRLGKKLLVLTNEQTSIAEESNANDLLGNDVALKVTQKVRPSDASKFRSYVDDVGYITMLLLSLSGRLARTDNALHNIEPNHPDKKILESKRERLLEQLDEAKELKDDIDRRGSIIARILEQALTPDEYADYDYFVNMKAKLIVDSREIADKITLGEEQLRALKDTLVQSEC